MKKFFGSTHPSNDESPLRESCRAEGLSEGDLNPAHPGISKAVQRHAKGLQSRLFRASFLHRWRKASLKACRLPGEFEADQGDGADLEAGRV